MAFIAAYRYGIFPGMFSRKATAQVVPVCFMFVPRTANVKKAIRRQSSGPPAVL